MGRGVGGGVGRTVGWGVGAGVDGFVGLGVGGGVGRTVGWGVGAGVAVGPVVGGGAGGWVACGVAGGVAPPGGVGVGVGTTATMTSLGAGEALETSEGCADPDDGGSEDDDGPGTPLVPAEGTGTTGFDAAADAGAAEVTPGDDGVACAIPPRLCGGTKPAVSATVARMRFRRPIATTRRARCAVVTVLRGLLRAERGTSIADPMDGSTGPPDDRPDPGCRLSREAPPRG